MELLIKYIQKNLLLDYFKLYTSICKVLIQTLLSEFREIILRYFPTLHSHVKNFVH
jgi:hypothetical protein